MCSELRIKSFPVSLISQHVKLELIIFVNLDLLIQDGYRYFQRNFQPLEVVGRGSEPQLQVAENLNELI